MAKGGWCIDSLHDKDGVRKCQYEPCDCWCHTGATKPPKNVAKPKKRAKTVADTPPKLNKDGSVAKRRGRPPGSKNKPKGKK